MAGNVLAPCVSATSQCGRKESAGFAAAARRRSVALWDREKEVTVWEMQRQALSKASNGKTGTWKCVVDDAKLNTIQAFSLRGGLLKNHYRTPFPMPPLSYILQHHLTRNPSHSPVSSLSTSESTQGAKQFKNTINYSNPPKRALFTYAKCSQLHACSSLPTNQIS